jgi:hypothetical protein
LIYRGGTSIGIALRGPQVLGRSPPALPWAISAPTRRDAVNAASNKARADFNADTAG